MSSLISKYSVLATAPPIIVRKSYDTFIQKNLKESQAGLYRDRFLFFFSRKFRRKKTDLLQTFTRLYRSRSCFFFKKKVIWKKSRILASFYA